MTCRLEEEEGELTVKEDKHNILCWSTLELKASSEEPTHYVRASRPKRKKASICYNPKKKRKTFEEKHNDVCEACDAGGELLCCDTCNTAWHLECCDPVLKEVPEGDWSCQICVEEKEDKRWDDFCMECKLGGELLCCDTCPKAIHLECAKLDAIPEGEWQCNDCVNNDILSQYDDTVAPATPPASSPVKNPGTPGHSPSATGSHPSQPTAAMTAAEDQLGAASQTEASSGRAGRAPARRSSPRLRPAPRPPATLSSITVG